MLVPIDWNRALNVPLRAARSLRLVDLDGLLALKLRAGGPQDLLDVAMLLLLHPEHVERARELAVAYRVADKLESWLADPLRARAGVGARRGQIKPRR